MLAPNVSNLNSGVAGLPVKLATFAVTAGPAMKMYPQMDATYLLVSPHEKTRTPSP